MSVYQERLARRFKSTNVYLSVFVKVRDEFNLFLKLLEFKNIPLTTDVWYTSYNSFVSIRRNGFGKRVTCLIWQIDDTVSLIAISWFAKIFLSFVLDHFTVSFFIS